MFVSIAFSIAKKIQATTLSTSHGFAHFFHTAHLDRYPTAVAATTQQTIRRSIGRPAAINITNKRGSIMYIATALTMARSKGRYSHPTVRFARALSHESTRATLPTIARDGSASLIFFTRHKKKRMPHCTTLEEMRRLEAPPSLTRTDPIVVPLSVLMHRTMHPPRIARHNRYHAPSRTVHHPPHAPSFFHHARRAASTRPLCARSTVPRATGARGARRYITTRRDRGPASAPPARGLCVGNVHLMPRAERRRRACLIHERRARGPPTGTRARSVLENVLQP